MRVSTVLLVCAALVAGASNAAAPASAQPVTGKKPAVTLTLHVNKTKLDLGGKVVLQGKVKPRKGTKGEKVTIQQKTGTKPWKVVGRAKINAKGAFTWSEVPTTATTRKYRGLLPSTRKHRAARTAPVKVAVWTWHRVTELRPANYSYMAADEALVKGKGYFPSLNSFFSTDWGTSGHVEYNLYGRCTQLRTAAALTDEAETASTARARVLLNGAVASDLALTQVNTSMPLQLALAGVNRIRFELTSTSDPQLPQAAFLKPEFYCSDL